MELPQLIICTKNGFKADALEEMGYSDDILTPQWRQMGDNYDFDAEGVWQKGTYSTSELAAIGTVLQGNLLFVIAK